MTKVIAIVGPTASGKSSLGIFLAQQLGGEIITVDSRTVFRGMDIGTAKPAANEGGVPHWGVDIADPSQEVNIAIFRPRAEQWIEEIAARGHVPILVGGSGLWMDTMVDQWQIPEVPPDRELRAELERKTLVELQMEYKSLDPLGAEVIDEKNKRRLVRAIEVCRKTGRPFSEQRVLGPKKYDALWIGLDRSRPELMERIRYRAREMFDRGLEDEVHRLYEQYGSEAFAMSGLGYRQLIPLIKGQITRDQACEQLVQDTRSYAKRQMTWFIRRKETHWLSDSNEALALALSFLGRSQ